MLRNIFLKSIRDSRYTFLYVFLTYLFVCSLVMYVVSELPLNEIQIIFERLQLPEPLMSFIGGEGGLNLTTVEGILNTDMFTVFAPLISIGFSIYARGIYDEVKFSVFEKSLGYLLILNELLKID